MKCFCKEFGERKGVEIDFRNEGQPSLVPPDVSICLFRILQEALYYEVKHSEAQRFEVRLWETLDDLHLRIRDSGVGFDVDAARKGSGLGLIRMEQHLKLARVRSRSNRDLGMVPRSTLACLSVWDRVHTRRLGKSTETDVANCSSAETCRAGRDTA